MKCENCGHELLDGQKFCSNCGTEVVAPEEIVTPVVEEAPAVEEIVAPAAEEVVAPAEEIAKVETSKKKLPVVICAIVAAVVIAIIACIIGITSGNGDCYPKTDIPTYTSVTDVECRDSFEYEDLIIYEYPFTDTDTVSKYWHYLVDEGWSSAGSDDEDTEYTFESGFTKGDKAVIVNVYLEENKIWVAYKK